MKSPLYYASVTIQQEHAVRFLVCELLSRSGLWPRWSDLVTFERFGYRMRLFPATVCKENWSNPALLRDEQHFFRGYLRPGDVIVDAGANVGDAAMFASKIVGAAGSVHAIEAHPRTFAFLREHVRMNRLSNITLYNVALGASTGDLSFSDLTLDDRNHVSADGINVRQARLDDVLRHVAAVSLLKVDVEGYEKFVFEGATTILARTECILFESWESHFRKYGYCCNDVFSLLRSGGFTIMRQEAGDPWRPIESGYRSERCENLVAVRDVKRFGQRYGDRD